MQLTNEKIAGYIAAIVTTLMAFGVVFVFSASARVNIDYQLSKLYTYPEFRQIIFFVLAIAVLYLFSIVDYRKFSLENRPLPRCPIFWLLIFSIILLVAVLIPGVGTEINYARRWLRIPLGPITVNFQPSELAKWTLVFFVAAACARFGNEIRLFKKRFIPLCATIGLVVGLVIIEDFGTAAFLAMLSFAILLIAGAKLWHFAVSMLPLAGAFCAAIMSSTTRMNRLKAFFFPDDSTSTSVGYQAQQSLIAISTGGLLGKGLGSGISKYGHLPEDTTDFIFAIIAEELGFIGASAVLLLFIALAAVSIIVVRRCTDPFGKLLALGISLTICTQASINIGVATHLLPTKGIALPFVSAGGSGLLLTAAAAGILINIAKQPAQKDITDKRS